jgi:hypothetical protein
LQATGIEFEPNGQDDPFSFITLLAHVLQFAR